MHILMHRHSNWQGHIRCSTNTYASLFMDAGHDITYLQGIVHAGHLLARRGQYSSWQRGPRREGKGWVFTPLSLVPFANTRLLFRPAAAELAYLTAVPPIRHAVKRSGFGCPDVLWVAPLGATALRRIYPNVPLVCQVVDYYPAFSRFDTRRLEKRDYHRADHIFLIGHAMRSYLLDELGVPAEKVTVLGQGVFHERYRGDLQEPEDLQDLPHPRAIWVGWGEKLDEGLMHACALRMHQLGGSVVLIGPPSSKTDRIARSAPGVTALGPRLPSDVPRYLAHSDVGLMLYDREKEAVYRGQNPLKLYEYAAAGLAIVSTPHDEYAFIRPPVSVVSREHELDDALMAAARSPESSREATRDWAAQYDWNQCADRALAVLGRL